MKPVGLPATVNATAELNPNRDFTVTVELPEPPCGIVTELGDVEIEKSGWGTMTVTLVVRVSPPPTPVTVMM